MKAQRFFHLTDASFLLGASYAKLFHKIRFNKEIIFCSRTSFSIKCGPRNTKLCLLGVLKIMMLTKLGPYILIIILCVKRPLELKGLSFPQSNFNNLNLNLVKTQNNLY